MIRTLPALVMAFASIMLESAAVADFIHVSQVGFPGVPTRSVTAAESNALPNPTPAAGDVYQFAVTTDGDILAVRNVLLRLDNNAELYQHSFGDPSNAEPGHPVLIPVFPSLAADSWITTPGVTSRLGPDLPGDGTTTFFDLSDDGPQSDFIFAQFTVPQNAALCFHGEIVIASSTPNNQFSMPFAWTNRLDGDLCVPEPATAIPAALSLAGLAIATARRRLSSA